MKKLLILLAILMTTLPGSAFAQRFTAARIGSGSSTLPGSAFAQPFTAARIGSGSSTTTNGSQVNAIGSPVIEIIILVPVNVSVGSSGNQTIIASQKNFGMIGIGAAAPFIGAGP